MKGSEAEIIEGCKAGKRESQRMLYTNFSGKMFAVCLRYSKNREEAEDALQEGFIKVFRGIDKYAGAGSFEGWIRKIMVNTALEAMRKRKITYYPIDDGRMEETQDSLPDVFYKIAVQDLLRFIQDLPDGFKAVFNLYAIEGYQHKEIGDMLGISESTSRSQLTRARQMLQQRINGYSEGASLVKNNITESGK